MQTASQVRFPELREFSQANVCSVAVAVYSPGLKWDFMRDE